VLGKRDGPPHGRAGDEYWQRKDTDNFKRSLVTITDVR
jgi:hypothetical protein